MENKCLYKIYVVDPETQLEGNQISYSCFAKLNSKSDKLEIVDSTPSGLSI